MNIAPRRGEYREVICLKTLSIIHIDWGNIEVFEGQTYRECLSGYGYLKENICGDNGILIEINGYLWLKFELFVSRGVS
jgi:hypothetical protein